MGVMLPGYPRNKALHQTSLKYVHHRGKSDTAGSTVAASAAAENESGGGGGKAVASSASGVGTKRIGKCLKRNRSRTSRQTSQRQVESYVNVKASVSVCTICKRVFL